MPQTSHRPALTSFHVLTSFIVLFFAVLVAATASFPAAAKAQTSPEGVKRLEAIFSEILNQYRETSKASAATLETEGRILVEPTDRYYAVTLPHLKLKQADGAHTDIGMISINALPGDTADQWKMTVALPTPVIRYNSAGGKAVTVTVGSQNFAGVWHEAFKNFIRIQAQYADIVIEQHDQKSKTTIPSASMVYDLQRNAEGRWSGPADIVLNGLEILFDGDGSAAKFDRIAIKSVIDDYSLEAALAYQEKITALTESYGTGKEASISSAHATGLYNLIAEFLGTAWDGFDFSFDIKGFSMTRPPIPGAPEGLMKFDSGTFGFGMDGFRSGAVKLGLSFGYDGFVMQPLSAEIGRATPDHASLRLGINNLPYRELINLGRDTIQGASASPQSANLAGLQALVMVPQLLTQAKTNLTLQDTSIGNAHYNVDATALFTANIAAALGMTGNARAEVFGLDGLIDSLTKAAADPALDEETKKKINDGLATLSILKIAGQMGTNGQGQPTRTYDFTLTEKGQTMLNGTDLQILMQSLESRKAP